MGVRQDSECPVKKRWTLLKSFYVDGWSTAKSQYVKWLWWTLPAFHIQHAHNGLTKSGIWTRKQAGQAHVSLMVS
jgi:hypothetical protein